MQTTITIYTACTRCNGFRNAFKTFRHVAGGKCLLCGGGLRRTFTMPVSKLRDHRVTREQAIEVVQHALAKIGAPAELDAKGAKVSPWGFDYHVDGDSWHVLAAVFSRCDAKVRARGYAAIVAKIETAFGAKSPGKLLALRTAMSRATGIPVNAVDGWARGTEVAAAA